MHEFDLSLSRPDAASEPLTVPVERLVNVGFTGRNEADVRAHIEELEKEGVSAPDDFPVLYPKPNHLVVTDGTYEVISPNSSGEAEFALFVDEEETYVGVGSDHTDRELEADSIVLSKAVCPNVVSREVWALSDVADHWDELELRSWTGPAGELERYQDTSVAAIKPPGELLEVVDDATTEPLSGTAVFSGSVGTVTGELVYGEAFAAELHDPVTERTIRVEYEVTELDWLA